MVRNIFLLGALSCLLGCGSRGSGPDLVPVVGTVFWNEQPLAGAILQFEPVDPTPPGGGITRTRPDGTYQINFAKGGNGLPSGTYKVTVRKLLMPDNTEVPADMDNPVQSGARESLPPKFSDPAQTTLRKTISPPGAPIDFQLRP